jgi:hypothetical protein
MQPQEGVCLLVVAELFSASGKPSKTPFGRMKMRLSPNVPLTSILFCLTTIALTATSVSAATTAFSFTSATFRSDDSNPVELGYIFTTGATPLSVTSLGYINDGFNGTHTFQIYQVSDHAPLLAVPASVTTVGGGSTSNSFSYIDLPTPVLLAADTSYQLVSQAAAGEHYFTSATGFSAQDGLTIQSASYDYSNTTTTPTFAVGETVVNVPGDFGPNFQFNSVPEPTSLALLLGIGFSTLIARRRRARSA